MALGRAEEKNTQISITHQMCESSTLETANARREWVVVAVVLVWFLSILLADLPLLFHSHTHTRTHPFDTYQVGCAVSWGKKIMLKNVRREWSGASSSVKAFKLKFILLFFIYSFRWRPVMWPLVVLGVEFVDATLRRMLMNVHLSHSSNQPRVRGNVLSRKTHSNFKPKTNK